MPEQAIVSKTISSGTLVTAPSFLIDRFKPDCEIITLPEKVMARGTLRWETGAVVAKPPKKNGLRALINGNGTPVTISEDRWIIDLRDNSPANWAHFLNNHLPLLFASASAAGLDPNRALALLPTDIPQYILNVAALFGITTHLTDGVVEGHGVICGIEPWGALRTARADWVRLAAPQARLAAILAEPPETSLPKKVFLTRKDTRTLSNKSEVEEVLTGRGFESVLPETLSPADQFRLILGAEEIVAIHGAGLAPLLYCTPGAAPKLFIELLPCGLAFKILLETLFFATIRTTRPLIPVLSSPLPLLLFFSPLHIQIVVRRLPPTVCRGFDAISEERLSVPRDTT